MNRMQQALDRCVMVNVNDWGIPMDKAIELCERMLAVATSL